MGIDRDTILRRFLDYVSYNTQSDENIDTCPSTDGQVIFADHLVKELQGIGLSDVEKDINGYIMATVPATVEGAPTIGFISHMDTAMDAPGDNIHPSIVHFDGSPITLNKERGIRLSPVDFPDMNAYQGQDIIVTDGRTLLGADDKAGLCAIVSAAEQLVRHPELVHGTIRIGFTPDEETGRGADHFDVAKFGADFAYTVDGGAIGGIEYENFNAAGVGVVFHGRAMHTGSAKGHMLNAISLAAEWQGMLPESEKPEHTEGREGFFHVYGLIGDVSRMAMKMLIRDFDTDGLALRKKLLEDMADFMNKKYGAGTVELMIRDSYANMYNVIKDHMDIVELAKRAMKASGVEPRTELIRGGTDGARLSYMGLPCPNLFTGGHNFHGVYEYLPVDSLVKASVTILNIALLAAGGTKDGHIS